MKIAVVVIAYNRVDSLERLLHSLSNAYYDEENIPLIISIDKSNTDIVEKFAESFLWTKGPKRVICHKQNLGLKKHILGLGDLTNEFDAIILLEDDLVVSPNFYRFAKQTVDKYHNNSSIAGISLYGYSINYENYLPFEPYKNEADVYFMNFACSWGEIWMKQQFAEFKVWYDNNMDFPADEDLPDALFNWGTKSWLRYFTKYCIKKNKYFVYPYYSITTNYGDVGTNHSSNRFNNPTVYQVQIQSGNLEKFRLPLLDEDSVRYDAYYNNELLYNYFSFTREQLCLDIYGNKHYKGERYWLTSKTLDYCIVRSFALSLRPVEANIFNNVDGYDLFLYDTSIIKKNKFIGKKSNIPYFYRIRFMPHFVMRYGINQLLLDFSNGFIHKLKNLFLKK